MTMRVKVELLGVIAAYYAGGFIADAARLIKTHGPNQAIVGNLLLGAFMTALVFWPVQVVVVEVADEKDPAGEA